jgi:hypothetical protein
MKTLMLTGHQNTWHVLVATRNNNHSIEVMASSGGLDLVCNQISGLQ